MKDELLILRFPDLLAWEWDLFAPVVSALATLGPTRLVDVGPEAREALRAVRRGAPAWALARDWRRALRYLSPQARARLYLSVLELGSPKRHLSTLFVKRFSAGLPQGVKLLTYSPLNFRFFREMEGMGDDRVEPVALGLPAVAPRAEVSAPGSRLTVGTFAPFLPESNLHFVLNVAHYVCHRHPTAHFRLAGRGPLKGHLQSIVRDLKLDGRVSIVDSQSAHELSAMDVFLYAPLRNDHFGPLLHAAAMGVACLTTEVPGVEEFVTDGADGFVLPVNETKPMGELALRLLEAPALRQSLGARLGAAIGAKYPLERLARRYAGLFFGAAESAPSVSAVA